MTDTPPAPIPVASRKADLLRLPHPPYGEERGWWDSLLVVPARTKHESGFAHIAVIGVRGNLACVILAYPDALDLPPHSPIAGGNPDAVSDYPGLMFDAIYPAGTLRLFGRGYEFSTTAPMSSVQILIRPTKT